MGKNGKNSVLENDKKNVRGLRNRDGGDDRLGRVVEPERFRGCATAINGGAADKITVES